MARRLRSTLSVFVVALALVLGPPVARTVKLANSADGLLLLASFSDSDFDWNPWSQDCYLIHQSGAVWLLSKFDWPYRYRSGLHKSDLFFDVESSPLVSTALASRGLGDASLDERMLTLMDVFLRKGESIEERWQGYTPVQAAILQGDTEAAKFLIDRGADLSARIDQPGTKVDELNSFEFVDFLYSKRPEAYQSLRDYVDVFKTVSR
ncbi:MAG: hypothetical protein AAFN07_12045 [Pseudomonadota bacterium]